jgi:hypothetical protein
MELKGLKEYLKCGKLLTLFKSYCSILVCFVKESLLNYRIIVNTVQCDSICRYLLPLHVSIS